MSRLKIMLISCMAVLGIAVLPAMAQAASPEWAIENGKNSKGVEVPGVKTLTELGLASESINSEATETFKLAVPSKLTLECTKQSLIEGKITPPNKDSGKVSFSGCSVVGAAACKVTEPITTVPLTTELKLKGTEVYDTFKPTSGTTFVTIVITNCALAGSYPVTGQTCGKATNALGTMAAKQELQFSGAITTTCVNNGWITGGLKVGTVASTLTGKATNFLTGANVNKKWGAI